MKSGTLKKTALKLLWMILSAHDGMCQKFFRMHSARHSMQDPSWGPTLQILWVWRFYQPRHSFILPHIIKIRNNGIYSPQWSTNKFSNNDRHHHKFQNSHLQSFHRRYSQKPHNWSDHKAKPIIKQPFQDHPSPVTPSQDHLLAPFQDHKQSVAPFKDLKVQIIPPSQDHLSITDVRDRMILKHAFPTSLDTLGNMSGEYTMHVDLPVPQYSMHTGEYQ